FGPESSHELVTRELPEKQHLDRDNSIEADLAGAVNNPHSSPGNLFDQFVIAKPAGGTRWGIRRVHGIGQAHSGAQETLRAKSRQTRTGQQRSTIRAGASR